MTDLDKRLQELALCDWEAFCGLTKIDMKQVAVCLLRGEGLTFGQISQKLKITKSKVQRLKKSCGSISDTDTR